MEKYTTLKEELEKKFKDFKDKATGFLNDELTNNLEEIIKDACKLADDAENFANSSVNKIMEKQNSKVAKNHFRITVVLSVFIFLVSWASTNMASDQTRDLIESTKKSVQELTDISTRLADKLQSIKTDLIAETNKKISLITVEITKIQGYLKDFPKDKKLSAKINDYIKQLNENKKELKKIIKTINASQLISEKEIKNFKKKIKQITAEVKTVSQDLKVGLDNIQYIEIIKDYINSSKTQKDFPNLKTDINQLRLCYQIRLVDNFSPISYKTYIYAFQKAGINFQVSEKQLENWNTGFCIVTNSAIDTINSKEKAGIKFRGEDRFFCSFCDPQIIKTDFESWGINSRNYTDLKLAFGSYFEKAKKQLKYNNKDFKNKNKAYYEPKNARGKTLKSA